MESIDDCPCCDTGRGCSLLVVCAAACVETGCPSALFANVDGAAFASPEGTFGVPSGTTSWDSLPELGTGLASDRKFRPLGVLAPRETEPALTSSCCRLRASLSMATWSSVVPWPDIFKVSFCTGSGVLLEPILSFIRGVLLSPFCCGGSGTTARASATRRVKYSCMPVSSGIQAMAVV